MNSIVSNQIIKLRKEKSLTQQALAEIINVSTAAVCKWETGASIPDINTLCSLADYFDVTVDYLLGRITLQKKCVVFCNQKNLKYDIEKCVHDQGIILQAYTESITELIHFLSNSIESISTVIFFSTTEDNDYNLDKIRNLKEQHGFKLLVIKTSTKNEFEDLLALYINNFEW